jgi:hypothetical protein
VLVAGGTSTGKTTLVNPLLAEVAKTGDRIAIRSASAGVTRHPVSSNPPNSRSIQSRPSGLSCPDRGYPRAATRGAQSRGAAYQGRCGIAVGSRQEVGLRRRHDAGIFAEREHGDGGAANGEAGWCDATGGTKPSNRSPLGQLSGDTR